MTTADIVPRLTKEMVTDVVLVSMLFLPRSMPVQFQETFTPIAAAGSSSQRDHLGRLMATQMTNAGIGVGIDRAKEVSFFYHDNAVSYTHLTLPTIYSV